MKTTLTLKITCPLCAFKVEREIEINEFGYFEVIDAYCPNDFSVLFQNIDGREKT